MIIQTYQKYGYHIIDLKDKITLHSDLKEVKDEVGGLVAKGVLKIALHFSEESYLSSRSIAVLVICNEIVRDAGGLFVIITTNNQITGLLTSLSIRERFIICASKEELETVES